MNISISRAIILTAFLCGSAVLAVLSFAQSLPALPSGWVVHPSAGNGLGGIACVSAADCWATGSPMQHWDGIAWSEVSSPSIGSVGAIACTASSECWAVGSYATTPNSDPQALIEEWDGNSWFVAPNTPSAGVYSYLDGVACASSSDCWAVGDYFSGTSTQTLIEHWDGKAWTIVNSPNGSTLPAGKLYGTSPASYLLSVSCASTSQCWAVGYYFNAFNQFSPLVEQWDGNAWTTVPSPTVTPESVGGTLLNESDGLWSVTCPSPSECWAVGIASHEDPVLGLSAQPLIEHWAGGAWAVVPASSSAMLFPGLSGYNYLMNVTCASTTECWAVGYTRTQSGSGFAQTLIEQWNGAAWIVVTSQNNPSANNYLIGVACSSPSQCWAIGNYGGSQPGATGSQTLILENPEAGTQLTIGNP